MKQKIAWHQVFSNYWNLDFSIPKEQITKYTQNLQAQKIQLELSNTYDEVPLLITKLVISKDPEFAEAFQITYQGQFAFEVAPGTCLVTDILDFPLTPNEPIYIKLVGENSRGRINSLGSSLEHGLVQVLGEATDVRQNFYYGVTTIFGYCEQSVTTVAFFGDSLTNQGYFTNQLAKQLYLMYPGTLTTMNAGISGNRLLLAGTSDSEWNQSFGPAGQHRFVKDVLNYQPDVVLFMEGLNDLFHPGSGSPLTDLPEAEAVIDGINQVSSYCEKQGVQFIPMTITPFKGAENRNLYAWSSEKEKIRILVNEALLKKEMVIDLASFVAASNDSAVLDERFDSGDHLHFSKQGGIILGNYLLQQLQTAILLNN